MKQTRRGLLVLMILLAVVISLCVLPAHAANDTAKLILTPIEAMPDEQFKTTLCVAEGSEIVDFQIQLLYDTDVVRLVSAKASKDVDGDVVVNSGQQGVLKINYTLTSENTSEQMPIVDLVFATDEEIGVGGYEFLKENTAAAKSADRLVGTDLVSVPLECDFSALNIYGSGDVDLNGNVEIRDVTRLRQYLAKIVTLTDYQLRMADAYYDEDVNVRDAVYIQQKLAEFDVQLGGRANIRFYDADGNLYATKSVVVGGELTKVPAVPERTGYSNGMWSTSAIEAAEPDLTSISKDVNLYAFYSDVPIVGDDEYQINYYLYDNDTYLQKVGVVNPNEDKHSTKTDYVLKDLLVDGYRFEGWYDGQGSNANKVTTIPAGTTGEVELYARWTALEYTINYECAMGNVPAGTYKVNQNTTLTVPTTSIVPEMANYVFLGWTNEEGKLVKTIPAGTTGPQSYTANWISRRNMTTAAADYEHPIIAEDTENGQILFAYEIGKIENVPLYTIGDEFSAASGIEIVYSEETTNSLGSTAAKSLSKSISSVTTQSQGWTLSNDWKDIQSVSATYMNSKGWSKEQAETNTTSSTGTRCINSTSGGTSTVTDSSGRSATLDNKASSSGTRSAEISESAELEVKASVGAEAYGVKASVEAGAKDTVSTKETTSQTVGWEAGRSNTADSSHVKTDNANWSTSSSFTASNTSSHSTSVATTLSEQISETKGYGSQYSRGGAESENAQLAYTDSSSDQYGSTLTYNSTEVVSQSTQFKTNGSQVGKYRVVCAGTVHVFGVVGYDIASQSYFTYTYNVMDDQTSTFLDYSYLGNFSDFESGIIPFEVPSDIYDYVAARTARSDGLQVDPDTGTVTGYNGSDPVVVVPAFWRYSTGASGTFKTVKITSIDPEAFKGNTNLKGVFLSNYVKEIPAEAFAGCTALEGVYCPGVTKIGDNAFAGCTSYEKFSLSGYWWTCSACGFEHNSTNLPDDYVCPECGAAADAFNKTAPEIGVNAFEGVNQVEIVAASKAEAEAAVACGAKNITLSLVDAVGEISGADLVVPSTTDSFVLIGGGNTYSNLKLKSDAAETTINGVNFTDCSGITLDVSAEKLNLEFVSIDATSYTLLRAETTDISLNGNTYISSSTNKSIICKNLNVTVSPDAQAGGTSSKLRLTGDLLTCGTVTGRDNIVFVTGDVREVTEAEFNRYARGEFTVFFDANGGSVSEESKNVYFGEALGTLPTPNRNDCAFEGWYTEDGTLVTEDTIFNMDGDVNLKAHWKSGWVLASELPEDGTVAENKWTYNLATRIESGSSTPPPGYSQYKDPTWVWGPWGGWSGWQNSNPGSGDSRQVETRWIPAVTHTEWNYSRYNEYDYASAGRRGWNGPTQGNWGGHYCQYLEYRGWSTTRLSATGSDSGYTIYDGNWYNEESKTVTDSAGYTQYRYRDRSKVWTYYYQMIEVKESATEILPTDTISNVQHWIQYIVQ